MADAPGWPGIAPRWTSSAKTGVGTALSPVSRVWFTVSHGILNEVYYPRVDQACIRDLGLIVTDGAGFFAEEKRDCQFETTALEDGVPAFQVVSTHSGGRFRITKHILTDPRHDVLLQQIRLEVLEGPKLRLFALLAPHLVNAGAHNSAWTGDYKGARMLFAEGGGSRLALAADRPFLAASVGFVGVSDGWQILHAHGSLADRYDRASDGNVALTSELDVSGDAPVRLALGFGRADSAEAAFHATAGLQADFNAVAERYMAGWRTWQASLRTLDRRADGHNTYRVSTSVLRCHESPTFPGALIASLSIPWGASKSDDDLGGYHLVWPRDLVQTAGGFLACGAFDEVRRVLRYLRAVQEADGSWPQNCWLDGMPYWHGLQLDECALPIVMVDLAWRQGALRRPQLEEYWPMVRAAAGFVVRRGPVTDQDRWEENAGYTPFTLAAEIAGLLAAADLAELHEPGEAGAAMAAFLRDTADAWEAAIDDWLYVSDTELARQAGVPGYYVRIAPPVQGEARAAIRSMVEVRNRDLCDAEMPAEALISTDTLALVRFGLRAPDDPRILGSVRVIDRALRQELPNGPGWRRYNGDGYGEHDDGSPFNGTGIGRVWPLLAGERAHYELAAGRKAEAERLLAVMEANGSPGRLLPEQVWDGPPMPERELLPGAPSGSAMPLVWAHAEHIKLLRSLADGAVFDLPPQPVRRYQRERHAPRVQPWRPDWRTETIAAGRVLRVDLPEPGVVAWSTDDWRTRTEVPTRDTGLGVHVAEVPAVSSGSAVFRWRSVAGGGSAGGEARVRIS